MQRSLKAGYGRSSGGILLLSCLIALSSCECSVSGKGISASAAAFAPSTSAGSSSKSDSRHTFGMYPNHIHRPFTDPNTSAAAGGRSQQTSTSTTALPMVVDFFRQRAEEGVEQLEKLANAAGKGKLGEGLVDVATYTKETNEAFAEGLAKSRNRLLYGLEAALTGGGDILEELEDVLLQADLGINTAEDVMTEVKSLREDSTQIFSKDDIRSILRGKLIEALEVKGDRRIRFEGMDMVSEGDDDGEETDASASNEGTTKTSIPTVLFVMGANGTYKGNFTFQEVFALIFYS